MPTIAQLLVTDQQKSAIGAVTAPKASAAFTPYGFSGWKVSYRTQFNGEPQDPFTQCYLLGNGYRAYSPVLRRFLSPDSLSPFGPGGMNSYVYCSDDPINASDPSGHVKVSAARVAAKNKTLLELIDKDVALALHRAIAENINDSKVIRKALVKVSNDTSSITMQASANWSKYMRNTDPPHQSVIRSKIRNKELSRILGLEPDNKPAGLTFIEIAMGHHGKDPTLGMDAISSFTGIDYKNISKSTLARMGEMFITEGKRIPTTHGYTGWIENSRKIIDSIRKS